MSFSNADYTNTAYNNMLQARRLPESIVNQLFDNADNLWKLLYYPQSTVGEPNVPDNIKADMIASTATGDLSNYQVFFELFNTDSTVLADAQLRLAVLEIKPVNRTNIVVTVVVQCIVNNKATVISTDTVAVENKAFAIAQEVVTALNGTELSGLKGALWLDMSQDRGTGIRKVSYSDNFSGYEIIFGAYI